jgi:hypothetical protein
MQKKILFATIFSLATLVCITPYVWPYKLGTIGKYTNAPGDDLGNNCRYCHSDNALNASGGTLAIKLLDGNNEVTEWVANKQYNLNVSISKPGAVKYGFEISAKKGATSTNIGTFSPGTASQFVSGTNGTYITHDGPGAGNWTFSWTAPAASSDPITFYVAANAANDDNQNTGDFIYTAKKTITSSPASISEKELFNSNVRVLENPVGQHLIVDFVQPKTEEASIKVYTLHGKEIKLPVSLQGSGVNKRFVVETIDLQQGLYIFSLQSGENQVSKKFLRK